MRKRIREDPDENKNEHAEKARRLRRLEEKWDRCTRCPHLAAERKNVVIGYGNPDSQIMVVGEGPWTEEDKIGYPFVGPAGMWLDWLLAGTSINPAIMELDEENADISAADLRKLLLNEVFYSNLIACKPTGDKPRPPSRVEVQNCIERLHQQIYIVDPVIIIAAGGEAVRHLTGKAERILNVAGDIMDVKIPGIDMTLVYPMMPILHPSYLLKVGGTDSTQFAQTYNHILQARRIVDQYNFENYGIAPPPQRPQPVTLRDVNQISDKAQKVKKRFSQRKPQRKMIEDDWEEEDDDESEYDGDDGW